MLGLGLATSKGGFVDALAEVTNTKSIIFDGGDEYVDCGNAIVTSYPFTVAGWLKPTLNNGLQVLTLSDVSASNVYYSIAWNSSNVFQLQARNTSIKKISSQTYSSLGGWYHIVGVFTSATDRTLYVNGVKDHSGEENLDSVTFNSNIDTTTLGALNRPSPAYGTGNLDEIAIWNDSLTANEVTQIYNSNKATLDLSTDTGDYSSSANLKGWWRMGDEASTRVVDDNANNLVIPDMRKTFFSGKSIGFDDSNDYLGLESEVQLTGEFSISSWVKVDSDTFDDSGNNQILGSSSGSGYFNIYNLNRLRIQTDSATSFLGFFDSSYTMTSDTWHHIVVTRDSSNDIRVYIDGQSRLSSAVSNSGTFDFDYIARSSTSGYFGGNLCDIAIYNTELNADTVASIYNSGEPNNLLLPASYTAGSGVDKTANLQAYWRMGNGSDGQIADGNTAIQQTSGIYQIFDMSDITYGSNLAKTGDDGVGSFTAEGGNNLSVSSGVATLTYVDTGGSGTNSFKSLFNAGSASGNLFPAGTSLTVGGFYKVSISMKVNTGTVRLLHHNTNKDVINFTNTEYTTVTYLARRGHSDASYIAFEDMDAGQVININSITVTKANGNIARGVNNKFYDIVDHAPNRNSGDMINFDATADIETDTP
jgi:hypothetical protein